MINSTASSAPAATFARAETHSVKQNESAPANKTSEASIAVDLQDIKQVLDSSSRTAPRTLAQMASLYSVQVGHQHLDKIATESTIKGNSFFSQDQQAPKPRIDTKTPESFVFLPPQKFMQNTNAAVEAPLVQVPLQSLFPQLNTQNIHDVVNEHNTLGAEIKDLRGQGETHEGQAALLNKSNLQARLVEQINTLALRRC